MFWCKYFKNTKTAWATEVAPRPMWDHRQVWGPPVLPVIREMRHQSEHLCRSEHCGPSGREIRCPGLSERSASSAHRLRRQYLCRARVGAPFFTHARLRPSHGKPEVISRGSVALLRWITMI